LPAIQCIIALIARRKCQTNYALKTILKTISIQKTECSRALNNYVMISPQTLQDINTNLKLKIEINTNSHLNRSQVKQKSFLS